MFRRYSSPTCFPKVSFSPIPEVQIQFIETHLKNALALTVFINLAKLHLNQTVEDLAVENTIKENAGTFIDENELTLDKDNVGKFLEQYFALSKAIQNYLRQDNNMAHYICSDHEKASLKEMQFQIKMLETVKSIGGIQFLLKNSDSRGELAEAMLKYCREQIRKTNLEIYKGLQQEKELLDNSKQINQQLSSVISSVFVDEKLQKAVKENITALSKAITACRVVEKPQVELDAELESEVKLDYVFMSPNL